MMHEEYMKIRQETLEDIYKEIEERVKKISDEKRFGENNGYYIAGLMDAQNIVHLKIVSEQACLTHCIH